VQVFYPFGPIWLKSTDDLSFIAESQPVAQKSPSNGAVGTDQTTSVEILTPTEGVDFNGYISRLIKSVRQNWYAVMPDAARKGEKGKVSVRFHIKQNGTLLTEEPKLESGSGKGPLDRAAVGAIRASVPFEHLPAGFHGPISNCGSFSSTIPRSNHRSNSRQYSDSVAVSNSTWTQASQRDLRLTRENRFAYGSVQGPESKAGISDASP